MDVPTVLKQLLAEGLTQADLAERLKTNQPTISRWMRGEREPMGASMERIRALAVKFRLLDANVGASRTTIPIMGYVGAGNEINPDYEQVPVDGFDQVDLRLALPEDVIGLQVQGDSMLPKYEDGDVIIVHREQTRSNASLVGQLVAVRTHSGRRFLKVLRPGPKPHTYNLESFNARAIVGVRLAWASEIVAIIPTRQVKRKPQRPARKSPDRKATERGAGR